MGSDRSYWRLGRVESEQIATPQFGVAEHPVNRLPHPGNKTLSVKHLLRFWRRDGGLARNRTGVQGFAVLCVTTPPRGLPESVSKSIGCALRSSNIDPRPLRQAIRDLCVKNPWCFPAPHQRPPGYGPSTTNQHAAIVIARILEPYELLTRWKGPAVQQ